MLVCEEFAVNLADDQVVPFLEQKHLGSLDPVGYQKLLHVFAPLHPNLLPGLVPLLVIRQTQPVNHVQIIAKFEMKADFSEQLLEHQVAFLEHLLGDFLAFGLERVFLFFAEVGLQFLEVLDQGVHLFLKLLLEIIVRVDFKNALLQMTVQLRFQFPDAGLELILDADSAELGSNHLFFGWQFARPFVFGQVFRLFQLEHELLLELF